MITFVAACESLVQRLFARDEGTHAFVEERYSAEASSASTHGRRRRGGLTPCRMRGIEIFLQNVPPYFL